MEGWMHALIDFVRLHQTWAAPIVLLLAFGESLAFISLLIPAWGALVAIGALVGASGISFWPIWLAGAIGASLGDWLSYWFGARYKHQVAHFGPLRASVPLAAGIFEMPYWRFQAANVVSALVWSGALLMFGDAMSHGAGWMLHRGAH
jgi:membrane protein DedA with SNARE-associated domain